MFKRTISKGEEEFRETLFLEWTRGLSPREQRISIFSHIRNIPYAIIPDWEGSSDLVKMMITHNRGWCGPKHILLIWMFQKLNIHIEYVIIPFRWKDQQVKYPPSLQNIVSYLPAVYHLCSKAFLDDKWCLLDVTWDPLLRKAGFPINDPWDGISETLPAVISTNSVKEKPKSNSSSQKMIKTVEFTHYLNKWLEEVRISE